MTDFVFLHGGGQGSWVWAETVNALARRTGGAARAVLLDVPGCGLKRGRDIDDLDLDAVVDELAAELDAAKVSDAVLIGHSLAGIVLPRLAEARPQMFRKVVYLSCCAPEPGQTVPQMMGSSVQGQNPKEVGWPVDPAKHDLRERHERMFCNDMAPAQAEAFLAKLGYDNWPLATRLASDWRYGLAGSPPATYLLCLRDGSLPAPWQERFAERFGARIVRIDAGHQAMNTQPKKLAELLVSEAAEAA